MAIRGWIIVAITFAMTGCEGQPPPKADPGNRAVRGEAVKPPAQPSGWKTFDSKDGGFSVSMPGTPNITSQPGRLFTVHMVQSDLAGTDFMVTYFDPPPRSIAPAVVEATMRKDRDQAVQGIQGTLKSEEKVTIPQGGQTWPGLASVMESPSGLCTSRLYAVGNRMYSLQVVHPKGQDHAADIAKFFDSFTVLGSTAPR
jgi:hypothetical protein